MHVTLKAGIKRNEPAPVDTKDWWKWSLKVFFFNIIFSSGPLRLVFTSDGVVES